MSATLFRARPTGPARLIAHRARVAAMRASGDYERALPAAGVPIDEVAKEYRAR